MKPLAPIWHILASGLGAAAFCCLFGGSLGDGVAAFPIGMLLWWYMLAFEKKQSAFLRCIFGGILVTLLSGMAAMLPFGLSFDKVVVGGIIPLVPGVTFSTSVREFFNGDYLSGIIHLIAAVLTAICIALGVCGGVALLQLMGGVSI